MTAIQSAFPALGLSGGTITGNLTIGGHLQFTSPAPGIAIAGGAGTNPPSPVLVSGSNDGAGTITWGTGTAPNTQPQVSVTFGAAWVIPGGGAPHIILSSNNAATEGLGIYASGASPTGFSIGLVTAPAAGQANTTYSVSYIVTG